MCAAPSSPITATTIEFAGTIELHHHAALFQLPRPCTTVLQLPWYVVGNQCGGNTVTFLL
jgi:hypothetical protein